MFGRKGRLLCVVVFGLMFSGYDRELCYGQVVGFLRTLGWFSLWASIVLFLVRM